MHCRIIVFITRIMKTVEYKLVGSNNNYKPDPLHYLLNVTLASDCNIAKRDQLEVERTC